MTISNLEQRLEHLSRAGVHIVDPRQTFVADDVQLDRIGDETVLHPGTRLAGSATWLGHGVEVGTEGPTTLVDCVFDDSARISSGYANGAVLLHKASLGANAHVRPGSLLEEQASTAHAVGLKHTVLMSFVTLGSLINFCDCLMTGGTSRSDHSEVGSGFIHFNFTPWGRSGDKATPSLVGDVPRGVFLRERRIFLGGAGGLVGPASVGFGAIAGAGQVVRNGISDGLLQIQPTPAIKRPVSFTQLGSTTSRAKRNVRYIANLVALRTWYETVRIQICPKRRTPVINAAIALLSSNIDERIIQLGRFMNERGAETPPLNLSNHPACPLRVDTEQEDYISWVKGLSDADATIGTEWLSSVVESVSAVALD